MTAGVEPTGSAQVPGLLELTDEVRALVLAATTTEVDHAELSEVAAAVSTLTARLARRARARPVRAPFDGPAAALASGEPYRLSPFNPFGIPLLVRFDADGRGASAELQADARHEGPRDHVHGGVSTWLMDSMLGILVQARGRRGVTAQLDTRFVRRTPLDVPLRLRSQVSRIEGRKVRVEGWIEADGERTVLAEGLFIEVGPDVR